MASQTQSFDNEAKFRCETRKKLRTLLEETQNSKEALENLENDSKFNRIRSSMNEIEDQIDYVREMQLDALVLRELASVVHQQGRKLEDYSTQLNMQSFINALITKFADREPSDRSFSWSLLGRDVGVMFRSIPALETMYGPIFREAKTRKAIERKQRSEELSRVKVTKADEFVQDENDVTEEASKKRLSKLLTTIQSLESQTQSSSTSSEPIDMLKLLVDPDSVVQTIENIFDFSFVIKKKYALLCEGSDSLPLFVPADPTKEKIANLSSTQRVLTMDVKNMKKLMEIMKYVQADDPSFSQPSASQHASSYRESQSILHRDNDLYAADSVWDQADILATQTAKKISGNPSSSSSQSQRAASQSQSTSSQGAKRKRAHADDDE